MTNHTFATIFKDESIQRSLSLFTPQVLQTIEAALFDKNGKPYSKVMK